MQCIVKKVDGRYQMDMKYGIVDYYDWDNKPVDEYETLIDKNITFEGKVLKILPQHLFMMHCAGIARNYTNYGEINYKITWNEGLSEQYAIEELINENL